MAGHRLAVRAAVVVAMAAGLLTAVAAPAHADHDVRLGGVGNIELRVGGGSQDVNLRVENRNGNHGDLGDGVARGVTLTMTVPLAELGVHITSAASGCTLTNNDTRMDCNVGDIQPGQSWSGVAQVGVVGNSNLQSGETRNGSAQVALTGNFSGQTAFNVRLQGPDRAPAVPEVAGFVTDEQTGEAIGGARVFLTDSQGVELEATTNDNGEFRFAGDQIAPGSLGLRASRDGYESNTITVNGVAEQALTGVQLAMRSSASPTPDPSPTASPTPGDTASPSLAPAADTDSSGGSFFTTLMIILGIVFVLLGVGAIALLIYRRRKEQEEDGEGPEGAGGPISGPPGPRPTPGSHGVYRPSETQVIGGAATQVLGPGGRPVPAVGPQPALANAQTMLHPRAGGANDQTAMIPRTGDPLGPRPPVAGSPPPPRSAAPTYGGTPATAYDDPRARRGGPPDRYDNPTELYGGQATDGYSRAPQRGPAYGSPVPGSSAQGGYPPGGSPPASPAYGTPAHGSPAGRPDSGGYGTEGDYRPAGGHRDGGYRAEPAPPAAGRHDRGGHGASYDNSSYGPDPYAQPAHTSGSGGYDPSGPDYGDQSYRGAGYDGEGYRSAGYDRPGGDAGYRGSGDYRGSGYESGHSGQTYGQPGHAAPPEQPNYRGNDYYDESGAPRSRQPEQPPERRRLDWLDD